jgi:hypothetical protein
MEQIIEDLIKTLEFAEEQYVTCENDVASIISAIRV